MYSSSMDELDRELRFELLLKYNLILHRMKTKLNCLQVGK